LKWSHPSVSEPATLLIANPAGGFLRLAAGRHTVVEAFLLWTVRLVVDHNHQRLEFAYQASQVRDQQLLRGMAERISAAHPSRSLLDGTPDPPARNASIPFATSALAAPWPTPPQVGRSAAHVKSRSRANAAIIKKLKWHYFQYTKATN
jgi:hypothetical protein